VSAPLTQAQRLAADAAAAAEVRGYQTDPDVVALRVERIRTQVERLMWAGMVLGLLFTMVNVQTFAAAGTAPYSLGWWAAWLLDPMVSLVLLGVLRAEQITARYQIQMGPWPRAAKWCLLSATYVMNTWSSWAAGSPSQVVLHSVPVLTVLVAAEAVTDCQNNLTECVHRAHTWATGRAQRRTQQHQPTRDAGGAHRTPLPGAHPVTAGVGGGPGWAPTAPGAVPVRAEEDRAPAQVPTQPTAPAPAPVPVSPHRAPTPGQRRTPARRTGARSKPGGRVLFAEYLATARQALTPGTEVTPAWVRQVSGCSRGLSSRLAAELRTPHPHHGPATRHDTDTTADRPTGAERKAA